MVVEIIFVNMTTFQKLLLLVLRVSFGWLFLYAGVTKLLDPAWTAEGYIKSAKSLIWFYGLLLQPSVLPLVNFVNEWGLTFLGLSLIFGVFVRFSSLLGAALMLLYYFVILEFPYPNPHSLIVDEHIIYALLLICFATFRVGRIWGLEEWYSQLPTCRMFPRWREWIG